MKYKPEDIKPKRYPDEKPGMNGVTVEYPVLLKNGRVTTFGWRAVTPDETMPSWDEHVTWFINVPNPPDTLCFLAYSENKPEQDGEYWCHVGTDHIHAIEHDSWEVMRWGWDEYNKKNDWNGYRILIDYFIPYRLDKENEMEDGKRMIWSLNRDHKYIEFVELEKENIVTVRVGEYTENTGSNKFIPITPKELTAFARHWLDLQCYDVVKREPVSITYRLDAESENEMDVIWEIPERYCEAGLKLILNQGNDREKFRYLLMVMINNDYEVGSKLNDDEVDSLLLKLGNHAGYEVTKREPVSITYGLDAESENEMDGKEFGVELRNLINKNSVENGCNTPDFILADFMMGCLRAFENAVNRRVEWYGDNKVTRKGPEIKACPNPGCEGECKLEDEGYEEDNEYYIRCYLCGYCSPIAYTPQEARRLHNQMPRKGE